MAFSIAEILQAQGDAAAKARQARGTMWGSLAQYAGTIPREILADRAQERERAQVAQVRQLQIQKGQAEAQQQQDEQGKLEVLRQVYRVAQDPTTGKLDEQRAAAIIAQSRFPELTEFMAKAKQAGLDKELEASVKRSTVTKNEADAAAANALAKQRGEAPPPAPPQITESQATVNAFAASVGKSAKELTKDDWKGYYAWKLAQTPEKPTGYGLGLSSVLVDGKPASVRTGTDGKVYDVNTNQPVIGRITPLPPQTSTGGGGANTDAVQQRLEQQYRGVLAKATSARSGPLGIEDAKVNQAAHLLAIYDQYFDPKTGEYNIPRVQYNELAAGLARLINPTGQVGIEAQRAIQQSTAAGDLAQAVTYATGTPVTGTTQAVLKMLKDSIERQGEVAETNRDTYFGSLRAQAPTDLAPERVQALEGALKLNSLRNRKGAATTAPAGTPPAGRMRVVGPNGETGTVPAGTPLLPGWKESR